MTDNTKAPITWEEINALRGSERTDALRRYHHWLKNARDEDKRIEHNKLNMIFRMKTKEGELILDGLEGKNRKKSIHNSKE
mgnify:CR=1 FL=1